MHPINKLLGRVGIQIRRIPQSSGPGKSDYVRILEHFGITRVLDVGAYHGISSEHLFEGGYKGAVASFEPLLGHFAVLNARVAGARKKGWQWDAHCLAFGDHCSEELINVAGNGQSSSLASMSDEHVRLNPESACTRQERVKVKTLDSMYKDLVKPNERVLLQLDVQGLEPRVLDGGKESIPELAGIQLEVSLRSFYSEGFDLPQAFSRMSELGFVPVHVQPEWGDMETRVFYQVDVMWIRKALAGAAAS